ncbi:hypothetical protein VNO77_15895 [Canavalia gladiata]|uniref:Uncharacterized protein n=1 Tax=Canavalia gladiata TaxID=3824 RepID=A0AAN9M366_CANGL
MSRPWALLCLLLLIVFTSQFEWKQQYQSEIEATPTTSQKLKNISQREESVKEKIILSQEKNIQRLHELVRSLREQLLQCKAGSEVSNITTTPLAEFLSDFDYDRLLVCSSVGCVDPIRSSKVSLGPVPIGYVCSSVGCVDPIRSPNVSMGPVLIVAGSVSKKQTHASSKSWCLQSNHVQFSSEAPSSVLFLKFP